MRSYKLTSAILAAAALLALASAGTASARSQHHRRANGILGAHCRISLNVAPRLVTSGETVLAYGQATCQPANEAGQTVTLYQRVAGSSGFAVAGTTTTDSHGFYQMTTAPETTNSQFYAAIGTSVSRHRPLKVAAQVALQPVEGNVANGLHTGRRNAVTFKGSVSPNDKGALVVLQRQNAIRGNEWHRIGHTIVDANGTFALTHVFVAAGASDIRVLVRSNRAQHRQSVERPEL